MRNTACLHRAQCGPDTDETAHFYICLKSECFEDMLDDLRNGLRTLTKPDLIPISKVICEATLIALRQGKEEEFIACLLDCMLYCPEDGKWSLRSFLVLTIAPAFVNTILLENGPLLGVPLLRLTSKLIPTDTPSRYVSLGDHTMPMVIEMLRRVIVPMNTVLRVPTMATIKILEAIYDLLSVLVTKDYDHQIDYDSATVNTTILYFISLARRMTLTQSASWMECCASDANACRIALPLKASRAWKLLCAKKP